MFIILVCLHIFSILCAFIVNMIYKNKRKPFEIFLHSVVYPFTSPFTSISNHRKYLRNLFFVRILNSVKDNKHHLDLYSDTPLNLLKDTYPNIKSSHTEFLKPLLTYKTDLSKIETITKLIEFEYFEKYKNKKTVTDIEKILQNLGV